MPGDGLEQLLDPELDDAPRRRESLAILQAPELVEPFLRQLEQLRESGYYRRLDETGRRRLQVLLPRLLRAVARMPNAEAALTRVLHVIERIGGRTVYLALLNENPVARDRLFELCAHSQFLADQIAAFPLLLDELLDDRLFDSTPERAELAADLHDRMANCGVDDVEEQVEALRQFQRAAMFRVAVPDLTGPPAADEGQRSPHRPRRADRAGDARPGVAADRRAAWRAAVRAERSANCVPPA